MKKVISFSLWGDSEMYVVGAIINADIAKREWKDWICRFYVSNDVPTCIINELKNRDNVEVVPVGTNSIDSEGMFWRFFACKDSDVMISRDTDSWLNIRDKAAVDEWLESDKDFHIIRDNCQHGWLIAGGMWGVRGETAKIVERELDNYLVNDIGHGADQKFLQAKIYYNVVHTSFVHDDWFPHLNANLEEKKPMPVPRFIGEGWWNNEIPDWHSGFEDDKDRFEIGMFDEDVFYDRERKTFKPCPMCGVYHDNEYIGKQEKVYGKVRREYQKIVDALEKEIRSA
tara:strand:+ start:5846 stop:6700 length:855 start_codon:yes stop_codon:yes gene_type:complete